MHGLACVHAHQPADQVQWHSARHIHPHARVQAVMIASYFLAKYADVYVAQSQRQELGLCTKCGGLNEGAAEQCPLEGCPRRQQWSP